MQNYIGKTGADAKVGAFGGAVLDTEFLNALYFVQPFLKIKHLHILPYALRDSSGNLEWYSAGGRLRQAGVA